MNERITTHLLVTLRHEKPIGKIADVVSCRLSMLEGVDGSGVDAVVVQPEEVTSDPDFDMGGARIQRVSATLREQVQARVDQHALNSVIDGPSLEELFTDEQPLETGEGDALHPYQRAVENFGDAWNQQLAQQIGGASLPALSEAERQAVMTIGNGVMSSVEAQMRERLTPLPAAVVRESTPTIEPINKDNLSREQFENTARLLTKGMGENITLYHAAEGLQDEHIRTTQP